MDGSVLATVKNGGPAGIRTLDTRIKSPMLCRAELQAHKEREAHLQF